MTHPDTTCPRCDSPLTAAPDAATLAACPSCGSELVHGDADTLSVSTAGDPFTRAHAVELRLTPAFRERYRLGARIGAGAMGAVFLATDQRGGRLVAVKFMLRADDTELRRRFVRECSILMKIQHPNVVRLLDADQLADHPFLVSEYAPQGSLAA